MTEPPPNPSPLLHVDGLCTDVSVKGRAVRVLHDVSLEVSRGETLGVAGESGCGKTTLARTLVGLMPAAAGRVVFDGVDVLSLRGESLRRFRRRVQFVFQDPLASLNPRFTALELIGEALLVHGVARDRRDCERRVAESLERVGLSPLDMHRRPHEFSGGQRQRIGIARAIALEPELILCDEPTAALDVSIQAQILNLLSRLQRELRLTYVVISHQLSVLRRFCDRVAIMYLGRVVEQASAAELFSDPRHPYTRALLSASPRLPGEPGAAHEPVQLSGEAPSIHAPPGGCALHPRCPLADARCATERPKLLPIADRPARSAACHYVHAPAAVRG